MVKKNISQDDLDFMEFALTKTPEESPVQEKEMSISPDELQFAEESKEGSPPPKTVSRTRSLLSAAPKGFLKIAGNALGALPTGGKTYEESLEEILPTQQGRFAEGALQRGAELGAAGGASGLGGILRSILGGVLGEGVHQAPFIPESVKPYAEAGAEISAFGLPGFGKRIKPTSKQASLVEEARNLGLTENEIAPLIQSEKKLGKLSKVAGKRMRTQKALQTSKNALDSAFDSFENLPQLQHVMSPPQADVVVNSIENTMFKKLNQAERNLIREDFTIFKSSKKSGEDFVKFFRDINKSISKNPESRKSLNLLKDDIVSGIEKISPEVGKTFKTTNELYKNYSNISRKLKPNWQEDISKWLGRGLGHAIIGPLFGYTPSLAVLGGEAIANNLGREMLINPRFQNLSRQIVSSLNSNKIGLATQLWSKLAKLVGKKSPKIALEMENVDWDSLKKSPEEENSEK